jgi:hypothetical protein
MCATPVVDKWNIAILGDLCSSLSKTDEMCAHGTGGISFLGSFFLLDIQRHSGERAGKRDSGGSAVGARYIVRGHDTNCTKQRYTTSARAAPCRGGAYIQAEARALVRHPCCRQRGQAPRRPRKAAAGQGREGGTRAPCHGGSHVQAEA